MKILFGNISSRNSEVMSSPHGKYTAKLPTFKLFFTFISFGRCRRQEIVLNLIMSRGVISI